MPARGVPICVFLALALGCTRAGPETSCCAVPEVAPGDVPGVERRWMDIEVPDLALVDQDGQSVALRSLLQGAGPVALNFVFTTCTTICPVMSATFSELEGSLGEGLGMVSISIDPEYDTPAVLKDFARKYQAGASWRFLTGSAEQIDAVLAAFDALSGSKMNHRPYTYFRVPGDSRWLRIEGLTSAAWLGGELKRLDQGHVP